MEDSADEIYVEDIEEINDDKQEIKDKNLSIKNKEDYNNKNIEKDNNNNENVSINNLDNLTNEKIVNYPEEKEDLPFLRELLIYGEVTKEKDEIKKSNDKNKILQHNLENEHFVSFSKFINLYLNVIIINKKYIYIYFMVCFLHIFF